MIGQTNQPAGLGPAHPKPSQSKRGQGIGGAGNGKLAPSFGNGWKRCVANQGSFKSSRTIAAASCLRGAGVFPPPTRLRMGPSRLTFCIRIPGEIPAPHGPGFPRSTRRGKEDPAAEAPGFPFSASLLPAPRSRAGADTGLGGAAGLFALGEEKAS